MLSYLETLTNVALLGTEKRTLPDPHPYMDGIARNGPAEEALLTHLAAVSLYVRGAREAVHEIRLPMDPAPADQKPAISGEAAYYLRQMVAGHNSQFLPEFLTTIFASEKRVPHVEIPPLLALGRRNVSLREPIRQLLTERGLWLARQNPDWAYAVQSINALDSFELGSLDERYSALCGLRASNVDRAREVLGLGWSKEGAKERAKLLTALSIDLSLADEAFLEAALDDKSKEVRAVAADLLARLPNSAYTQRMIDRAKPLLNFQRGGLLALRRASVTLYLPDKLDEQAGRDGIQEEGVQQGMGKKAWRFTQIISRVPLSIWTIDAPLETYLTASEKDDRSLLFNSWIGACQRFPNADAAAALLDYDPAVYTVRMLANQLTEKQSIELAAKLLKEEPLLTIDHPFLSLLDQTSFEWPEQLRNQFLRSLANSTKQWKQNWDSKNVLDRLVTTLPLDLLSACGQLLPQDATHPVFEACSHFRLTGEFRQKMVAAVRTL